MVMVPCPGLSCGSVKHAKSSISFCCCAAAMLFKAVLFLFHFPFFFQVPTGGRGSETWGKEFRFRFLLGRDLVETGVVNG